MAYKLRCSFITMWNCKNIAVGYWNGKTICKSCLMRRFYYVENYPNGNYGGTFTAFEDVA